MNTFEFLVLKELGLLGSKVVKSKQHLVHIEKRQSQVVDKYVHIKPDGKEEVTYLKGGKPVEVPSGFVEYDDELKLKIERLAKENSSKSKT